MSHILLQGDFWNKCNILILFKLFSVFQITSLLALNKDGKWDYCSDASAQPSHNNS